MPSSEHNPPFIFAFKIHFRKWIISQTKQFGMLKQCKHGEAPYSGSDGSFHPSHFFCCGFYCVKMPFEFRMHAQMMHAAYVCMRCDVIVLFLSFIQLCICAFVSTYASDVPVKLRKKTPGWGVDECKNDKKNKNNNNNSHKIQFLLGSNSKETSTAPKVNLSISFGYLQPSLCCKHLKCDGLWTKFSPFAPVIYARNH